MNRRGSTPIRFFHIIYDTCSNEKSITEKLTGKYGISAEIGTLSNGADVYFGDELNITYTAKEGYMLSDMGQTQVTVTEDFLIPADEGECSFYLQFSMIVKTPE